MTAEVQALISYRVEQADEALDSAQSLLERGNYRSVVNRAYAGVKAHVTRQLSAAGGGTSGDQD